ncbi:hypothetical protein ACD591_05790 [Rufibacter glacialis]|uniref:Outer membrane lipoprotein-sorting protein n=1 Tax=Rufibacter glacialis TaxID=1259555 RepID=A0A5M8QFH6_9BACT|nr:hypothetical protein [Rufibacter glacialis]KAA6433172.1 hypothetical protein FOE74_11840 [Rufibacter glacialis]
MRLILFLLLFSGSLLSLKCQQNAPATENSTADPKAAAIAQNVMEALGGQEGWDNTRYLAWTFNNQYHVWDKKTNDLRYERGDSLVVIYNLDNKEGQVFLRGTQVTDTATANPILRRMYPAWANNSYWLLMPYKLQDPGVTLAYVGEGKTQAGAPAEILQMTFSKVGVTPENKYLVAVDKQSNLITEWSYFSKYTDDTATFTRPWTNYQRYGDILLSSGRSTDPADRVNIRDIAVPASLPAEVFKSPTPLDRSRIK